MLIKVAKSKIKGWALSSLIGSVFIYIILGLNIVQLVGPFKSQSKCLLNLSELTQSLEWPIKVLALTLGW